MRTLLCLAITAAGLAACGGGGGGGSTPAGLTPAQAPGGRATASISFSVPVAAQQVANIGRSAQLAAGTAATFSIFEDGTALVRDAALQPGTYTDAASGTTAAVTAGSSAASLSVTAGVTSAAGSHAFSVAVSSADGTIVASAHGTYPLSASGSTAVAMALGGGVASGYIECATADQIAAGSNCANYANFDVNAAQYTFTAVAADASGYPIVAQMSGGAPAPFANGSYGVIESPADGAPIVSVTGGPWANPGAALAAPGGSYGNHFTVRCVRIGVAQLELQLATSPPALLPAGAHSPGSVSVNCTASGSLTIE